LRVDAGQWSELSVIFEGQLLDSTIGNSTIIFGDVERGGELGSRCGLPSRVSTGRWVDIWVLLSLPNRADLSAIGAPWRASRLRIEVLVKASR
jgi:hypothetical protein